MNKKKIIEDRFLKMLETADSVLGKKFKRLKCYSIQPNRNDFALTYWKELFTEEEREIIKRCFFMAT